jgi:hypothetical protein
VEQQEVKLSDRQQRAFTALAARKAKDRAEFSKAERTTGLARLVKLVQIGAKPHKNWPPLKVARDVGLEHLAKHGSKARGLSKRATWTLL